MASRDIDTVKSEEIRTINPHRAIEEAQRGDEVRAGGVRPADPAKLKANLDELEDACGIESTALEEEQTEIFVAVLKEIKPARYAGKYPPERLYEQGTSGIELFPFRWESISSAVGRCISSFP